MAAVGSVAVSLFLFVRTPPLASAGEWWCYLCGGFVPFGQFGWGRGSRTGADEVVHDQSGEDAGVGCAAPVAFQLRVYLCRYTTAAL